MEFDEEMGRNAHRIRFIRTVPDEMRKLASHIINDLRHSLDQGFVIASKFFGWTPIPKKVKFIYFPWSSSRRDLEGTLARWQIPSEIHQILFEAEPYRAADDGTGGNDIVRQLGKIAGPNKHEAVLTSRAIAHVETGKINWPGNWRIPHPENMWDEAKEQLTLGYFPVDTEGDYDFEIVSTIGFRDVPELGRRAASDLFAYWGSYAKHFVKRFEGRVAEALAS